MAFLSVKADMINIIIYRSFNVPQIWGLELDAEVISRSQNNSDTDPPQWQENKGSQVDTWSFLYYPIPSYL
jgi:hypothetical protein